MAIDRQNVLDVLNGRIRQYIDQNLHVELLRSIENASDDSFNSNVATSLLVLRTFDLSSSQKLDEEIFRWKSDQFIAWLKNAADSTLSVEKILIKLELLLISYINYKSVPIQPPSMQQASQLCITKQRDEFMSELMDVVLNDIVKALPAGYDFDWFYQSNVFNEIIFRLRNSNIFRKPAYDPVGIIYAHIKNTLTGKYRLRVLHLAQLLVDQFHFTGSDTIRDHLASFVLEYPYPSNFTLENFFNYKPELESIFSKQDCKKYRNLFREYCTELQKSAKGTSIASPSIPKMVDANTSRLRWEKHVSEKGSTSEFLIMLNGKRIFFQIARRVPGGSNQVRSCPYSTDDDQVRTFFPNSKVFRGADFVSSRILYASIMRVRVSLLCTIGRDS